MKLTERTVYNIWLFINFLVKTIYSNVISKNPPIMEPIVNPRTGRLIKPSTKLYNKLVKEQRMPNLYSMGGNIHELWTLIILRAHPSLLAALSLVNAFTNKIIYEKYSLEKWIDYAVRRLW